VRACLLLLVIACAPVAKPVAPAHESARPYLKLIEPDNEWTLPIVVTTGHFSSGYKPEQHTAGKVHCTIAKLEHIGEAAVSLLKCDKPYDDLSINGTWVAQTNGLYHPLGPITQPDDLASLVDDDLLIRDQPRERDHSHTGDLSTRTVEATKQKAGWCVHDKTTENGVATGELGDRRSFTLCFDQTGIVSDSEYDTVKSDGSWRSVQIGTNPTIDFDDPMHPSEPCEDC
jgi:hypothetical protein